MQSSIRTCTATAFPSKALAGVGVMFYVLLALRRHLRAAGALAAGTGSVACCSTWSRSARSPTSCRWMRTTARWSAAGLRRLRAGQGCAGLRALIEVAGRDAARLSATDIGYAIAPRLNAAGRLEDMSLGIECLLCDDRCMRARWPTCSRHQCRAQGVQQQMVDEAEAALARIAFDGRPCRRCCACSTPEWHPGVVGLVASKLKERVHRPVFAFAPA